MSYLLPSIFSKYYLNEEEQKLANTLTTLNVQNMQNLMCSAAEEKSALEPDSEHIQKFIQKEAYLSGQISILQMLISLAESATPSHTIVTHVQE